MKAHGSKYLLKKQLISVIRGTIKRLDTPEAADQLEEYIHKARSGGVFDDATAHEMLVNIAQVRKDMGCDL